MVLFTVSSTHGRPWEQRIWGAGTAATYSSNALVTSSNALVTHVESVRFPWTGGVFVCVCAPSRFQGH